MPRFSAFTAKGHQRFSSRPPPGEVLYRELTKLYGDGANYTTEWGSVWTAKLYAKAMMLAHARATQDRVGMQFRPNKAVEMLPALEDQVGLHPGKDATIPQRQAALAAELLTGRGATRENVEAVLRTLLGSKFVAYYTVPKTDIVEAPPDSSQGNWVAPGTPAQVVKILSSVHTIGTGVLVDYEYVQGDTAELKVGQQLLVDAGKLYRAERVTLVGVTPGASPKQFQATFTKPHDIGTLCTTGRYPFLGSNKRHAVVVVTSDVVADAETRRLIHRAMRKLSRGVSTWHIDTEAPS